MKILKYALLGLGLFVGLAISIVFQLIGLLIVPVMTWLHSYDERESRFFPGRYILSWNPSWAWIWGNEEDGIDGLPEEDDSEAQHLVIQSRQLWWWDDTKAWSRTHRIINWSAFRNDSGNLRYTPFGVKIDPAKIEVHWNSDRGWLVSQGWRASLRIYWAGGKFRTWFGWGLYPYDVNTLIARDDGRWPGTGYKVQPFKRNS